MRRDRKEMMTKLIGGAAAIAAITCTPVAHADPGDQAALSKPFSQAGAPFVGDWGAHEEHIIINSDGTGTETSSSGTVNFALGSVMNEGPTAMGNITSGGNAEPGSYVALKLVDSGRGLIVDIAKGDQAFAFCKTVNGNKLNSSDCGA
jgi:hypothetical protein